MAIYKILKICDSCGGDGIRQIVTGSDTWGMEGCGACLTTGKQEIGHVDLTDLEDKIDDVINKCNDIFEKVSE